MEYFWNYTLFTIHETPISALNLLICICTILLSFVLAKGVKRGVVQFSSLKNHMNEASLYSLGRLAYYVILFVGIYVALIMIGIDLTGIAVVIGALSVGIGFGLQTLFNNFVAGIILLLEKKIRVGARIQLESGDIGVVKEVHMRSTLIHTLDNRRVLVPNTEIVSKKVIYWTWQDRDLYRIRIPLHMGRGIDKEVVKRIALEAVQGVSHTATELPSDIWLTKVGETSQEFEVVVWIKDEERDLRSHSLSASYLWVLREFLKLLLQFTSYEPKDLGVFLFFFNFSFYELIFLLKSFSS